MFTGNVLLYRLTYDIILLMKMMRNIFKPFLIIIGVFAVSCSKDIVTFDNSAEGFQQEAKEIFLSSLQDHSNNVLNYLNWSPGFISPDWGNSSYYAVPDNHQRLIVPASCSFDYYFFQCLDNENNLLYNNRDVVIIKDERTGNSGVFVKYTIFDTNSGENDQFTGWCIYTSVSGNIVCADRFETGELISSNFLMGAKEFSDYRNRVRSFAESIQGIKVVRSKSRPGKTKFSYSDDLGWVDTLNCSVCYAEQDSCCVEELDEMSQFAYSDMPYDYGTTVNPSYGGGGCGGPGYSQHSTVSNTAQSVVKNIDGKELNIKLEDSKYKNSFNDIWEELAKNPLFHEIMKYVDVKKINSIKVKDDSRLASYQDGLTISQYYSTSEYYKFDIILKPYGGVWGYLEEFIHAAQYSNASRKRPIGDVEFEAKAIFAKYLKSLPESERDNLFYLNQNIKDNYGYYLSILEYLNAAMENSHSSDQIEELRVNALNAFARLGYLNFEITDDAKTLDKILMLYNLIF